MPEGVSGVAPATLPIVGPLPVPVADGATPGAARDSAQKLPFPDLLGELGVRDLVENIAGELPADGARMTSGGRSFSGGGDSSTAKGKKTERAAVPNGALPIDPLQTPPPPARLLSLTLALSGIPTTAIGAGEPGAATPAQGPSVPEGTAQVSKGSQADGMSMSIAANPVTRLSMPNTEVAGGMSKASLATTAKVSTSNVATPVDGFRAVSSPDRRDSSMNGETGEGEASEAMGLRLATGPMPDVSPRPAAETLEALAQNPLPTTTGGVPIEQANRATEVPVASETPQNGASGPRAETRPRRETRKTEDASGTDRLPLATSPTRDGQSVGEIAPVPPATPGEHAAGDPTAERIVASVRRETGSAPLAFAARLNPVTPTQNSDPSSQAAMPDAAVTPNPTAKSENVRAVERGHKPEPAAEPDRDASPTPGNESADTAARVTTVAPEMPARTERAAEERQATPAPTRPDEPVQAATVRPTAAQPAARDIRLELGGTDLRVEVRLEERAGEVRVSVRTPDGVLADKLRDHLPTLSARLEQSGFRADQWRAGDSSGETRPIEVMRPSGSGVNDERQHQGAHGGEHPPQEQSGRQRDPRGESQNNRNQKGKGFAWLMSSLE
jgi:hypothetical protein